MNDSMYNMSSTKSLKFEKIKKLSDTTADETKYMSCVGCGSRVVQSEVGVKAPTRATHVATNAKSLSFRSVSKQIRRGFIKSSSKAFHKSSPDFKKSLKNRSSVRDEKRRKSKSCHKFLCNDEEISIVENDDDVPYVENNDVREARAALQRVYDADLSKVPKELQDKFKDFHIARRAHALKLANIQHLPTRVIAPEVEFVNKLTDTIAKNIQDEVEQCGIIHFARIKYLKPAMTIRKLIHCYFQLLMNAINLPSKTPIAKTVSALYEKSHDVIFKETMLFCLERTHLKKTDLAFVLMWLDFLYNDSSEKEHKASLEELQNATETRNSRRALCEEFADVIEYLCSHWYGDTELKETTTQMLLIAFLNATCYFKNIFYDEYIKEDKRQELDELEKEFEKWDKDRLEKVQESEDDGLNVVGLHGTDSSPASFSEGSKKPFEKTHLLTRVQSEPMAFVDPLENTLHDVEAFKSVLAINIDGEKGESSAPVSEHNVILDVNAVNVSLQTHSISVVNSSLSELDDEDNELFKPKSGTSSMGSVSTTKSKSVNLPQNSKTPRAPKLVASATPLSDIDKRTSLNDKDKIGINVSELSLGVSLPKITLTKQTLALLSDERIENLQKLETKHSKEFSKTAQTEKNMWGISRRYTSMTSLPTQKLLDKTPCKMQSAPDFPRENKESSGLLGVLKGKQIAPDSDFKLFITELKSKFKENSTTTCNLQLQDNKTCLKTPDAVPRSSQELSQGVASIIEDGLMTKPRKITLQLMDTVLSRYQHVAWERRGVNAPSPSIEPVPRKVTRWDTPEFNCDYGLDDLANLNADDLFVQWANEFKGHLTYK